MHRSSATGPVALLLATLLGLSGFTGLPAGAGVRSGDNSPPTDVAMSWGANNFAQLGDGSTTNRDTPGDVEMPPGVTFTKIIGNHRNSTGLTPDGRVYSWGRNEHGQVGDGTTTQRPTPVEVPACVTIADIDGGDAGHSLALTTDGRVFAWGHNGQGQLGDGTTTDRGAPVQVRMPDGVTATAIATGGFHSMALGSDGHIYSWGNNGNGQLGDGTTTNRSTPVQVHLPAGTTATALSAGALHSGAVTSAGQVHTWGPNTVGQLGDGTTTERTSPVRAQLPPGTTVSSLDFGAFTSYALTPGGRVLAWGQNSSGQLGDGTTAGREVAAEVPLPRGVTVARTAAGGAHILALTTDGRVFVWGRDGEGRLGIGSTSSTALTPVELRPPDGKIFTDVGAGMRHSLALLVRRTATTLTAGPTTAAAGAPVTLTSHVTCGDATAGGEVTFYEGEKVLGTATLDAQGTATLTTTELPTGEHRITARYPGGTPGCAASASAPTRVTLTPAAPSTT